MWNMHPVLMLLEDLCDGVLGSKSLRLVTAIISIELEPWKALGYSSNMRIERVKLHGCGGCMGEINIQSSVSFHFFPSHCMKSCLLNYLEGRIYPKFVR